jgi:hypothetical protein
MVLCSGVSGCAKVAYVSGKVVENGEPYTPTAEMVALVFARTDTATRFSVSVQKDGSFVVYGGEGKGLPPGKYKVGYYSEVEGSRAKKRIKDLPAEKSALELELAAGNSVTLTIDLVRETMTKK